MSFVIQKRDTSDEIASGSVADGSALLFEGNWYFSPDSVDVDKLIKTERTYHCPYKGIAFWFDIDVNGERIKNVAWVYENPLPGYELIKNHIGFYARDTSGTIAIDQVSA